MTEKRTALISEHPRIRAARHNAGNPETGGQGGILINSDAEKPGRGRFGEFHGLPASPNIKNAQLRPSREIGAFLQNGRPGSPTLDFQLHLAARTEEDGTERKRGIANPGTIRVCATTIRA